MIGDNIYAGGDFRTFGRWAQSHFARFSRPAPVSVGGPGIVRDLRLVTTPNPFSGRSTLDFTLAARSDVELRVHDLGGRLVRVLAQGQLESGPHRFAWDGRDRGGHDVPHGIYFATLVSGATRVVTKLVKLN